MLPGWALDGRSPGHDGGAARTGNREESRAMEMRQLRTFATIVDLSSFTQAARRLGLSQPAISQQVNALERSVGVKLLVRAGTRVRPTPTGEIVLHYARQILHKSDELRRILTDHELPGTGFLRIGAGGAACHFLLPHVLKPLRDRFPGCGLRILSGPTHLTLERLRSGELDVGLVSLPVRSPRLRVVELGEDELVAIVPPHHPWAQRKRITPAEFAGESLLVHDRQSRTFQLIEQALLEAGAFPRVGMELDDLEAVKEMVRMGLGVAIVPAWSVRAERASRTLIGIGVGKHGLHRFFGLVFSEQDQRFAPLRALVRLCGEVLPPLLAS
jgi:DNA-binding transcriptional LysR family regulator